MSTKGQLISKCFLVFSISPKKQTKTSQPKVSYLVVKSNSFVHFLEEIDDPQKYFEINLPLTIIKIYILTKTELLC